MQWFTALIPAYPDIQAKAHAELDRVVVALTNPAEVGIVTLCPHAWLGLGLRLRLEPTKFEHPTEL